MNTFLEILTGLGGLAGVSAFIWAFINWKSRKKIEQANAETAGAEADHKVADNWKEYAEKMEMRAEQAEKKQEQKNKYFEQKLQKYFQFQLRIARALSTTTDNKRYAEYHICRDVGCPNRQPALGSFKTEDMTDILKEMAEFEKEEKNV